MGLKFNDVAPLTGQPVEQATAAPGELRTLSDQDIDRIAKAVANAVTDAFREVLRLSGIR